MKSRWGLLLAAGLVAGGFGTFQGPEEHVLILMGDSGGYLSPCGCTKPMSGGIRRRATAVRTLTSGKAATILENGGLASGVGRQDFLKAETLAEALRQMRTSAIALTDSEAKLGKGAIEAIRNLAGDLLVQSNLSESDTNPVARFVLHGPFLIGAVGSAGPRIAAALGEKAVSSDEAAQELVQQAADAGKMPVLLLSDGRAEAERLARAVPALRVIQYRSTARPERTPVKIGKTLLASPGEKGKFVLAMRFKGDELTSYASVELGPEFVDDQEVSGTYRRYLSRVENEQLLDRVPRSTSPAFAGTARCGSCHAPALKKWQGSLHAKALRTLIGDGHGRDPDCVGCHVVGLDKTGGFRSVAKTPQLANVGCESCHGPGAAHSARPNVKMGKVGARACAPCHVPDHSPNFDFAEYWRRIRH